MTPKKRALYYAILIAILNLVCYFIFDDIELVGIFYSLPLIIIYLIMYKVSDYIDIRYANIIVNAVIPLGYLMIINLLFR